MRAASKNSVPLWKDPFRIGILVLLIDTIAKATGEIPAAAAIRPGLLLFGFCAFYAVLKPATSVNMDVFRHRVPQLIIAQAVLACASALFGISLGHSAFYIITIYWKTLAVALLLILSLRNMSDVRYMVWATAAGGVLLAFTSVFIDHIGKTQGNGVYDANDIGTIVVMTLPLVILAVQVAKGLRRLVWIAGLVLIAETIVISGSRGAFIGLLALGLGLLLFLPGVSVVKRLVYLGAITTALTVFAPEGYWESMKNIILNPTADYNWDAGQGRRQVAKRGIGYMFDHPIFGLGIDNFAMQEGMLSDYAKETLASGHGVKWSAPHNSWVRSRRRNGNSGPHPVGVSCRRQRRSAHTVAAENAEGVGHERDDRSALRVSRHAVRSDSASRLRRIRDVRVVRLERPIIRHPGDRDGGPDVLRATVRPDDQSFHANATLGPRRARGTTKHGLDHPPGID